MAKKIEIMDGNQAAAYISYAFTEVAGIFPITPSSPMAEHVDDVFSKAFVMSAYADEVGRYNVNNVEIPMIGYVGKSNDWKTSDSGYMDSFFANKVGDENLVTINRAHGKVPINAFRRDADGDGKSDLIEWLLEDQALPENSDEY